MCSLKRPSDGDLLAVTATGVRSHFDEFTSSMAYNMNNARINNRYFAIFSHPTPEGGKPCKLAGMEFNLRTLRVMNVT